MATIRGDSADNVLYGTSDADAIYGEGGDDTLSGGAGRDSLYGGAGDDRLYGGEHQDLFDGGSGFDIVDYAGNATQALRIDLGLGRTSFPGRSWPAETLVGIEGAVGADGGDLLIGSGGDNYLYGRSGNDTLTGAAGADDLVGGYGRDSLSGGDGDDTLRGAETWDGPIEGDTLDGGAGFDLALYDRATSSLVIDLARGRATMAGSDIVDSLNGIEAVIAGASGDRLTGSTAANRLEGGDGNDTLIGGAGSDTLIGGDGNDLLWGQGSTDVLDGGAGLDVAIYRDNTTTVRVDLAARSVSFPGTLWAPEYLVAIEGVEGGSAADVLNGSADANRLIGNAGDDSLAGRGGEDMLDGGAGRDTLNGGAGTDTVSYASAATAMVIDLTGKTAYASATPAIKDTLISIESAEGGRGNDTLVGTILAETLTGGAGADSLAASAGNDILDGGLGNDTLRGGAGDDRFLAGAVVVRMEGAIPILADEGADLVDGGDGIDTVVVPEIEFGPGESDGWSWGWGLVSARINLAAGTLRWFGHDYAADKDIASARDTLAAIENVETGGGNDIIVGSAGANRIDPGAGSNLVYGGGGNDTVVGGSYAYEDGIGDTLYGGSGDDVLRGNGAAERMSGGQGTGTDFLSGDDGDDSLYAGPADHEMSGGAGADSFHFTDQEYGSYSYRDDFHISYESATIADFDPDEGDRIHIAMITTGETPRWVGETEELEVYDVGYAQDEAGTTVRLRMLDLGEDNAFYDEYLVLTLAGYSGALAASDFVFTLL